MRPRTIRLEKTRRANFWRLIVTVGDMRTCYDLTSGELLNLIAGVAHRITKRDYSDFEMVSENWWTYDFFDPEKFRGEAEARD